MELKSSGARNRVWVRALWQGVSILLIALCCGAAINLFRSNRMALFADWSPEARLTTDQGESMAVTLEEARRLCASQKAVFVDARSDQDYRQGHILCARNLPLKDMDKHLDVVLAGVSLEETIVVYCDGEDCMLSEDLAKELYFRGYDNVKVLVNGWTRWLDAGLPTGQHEDGSS
ncbi:MAG: rhodanese-like domain-containing protein [Deltaproteobacteria bacterium]|nr:rhodanese-like domain-containing protein [Deltaproteobacteria bacterium]